MASDQEIPTGYVEMHSNHTLSNRFAKYLNSELLSDVKFKVREHSQVIYGHKFLLKTHMREVIISWLTSLMTGRTRMLSS